MRGACSCLCFLVAVAVATATAEHPAVPWISTVPLPRSSMNRRGEPVVATTGEVIVVPSTDSKATVVALDARTGRVKWQHKDTFARAAEIDNAVVVQDAYCFTAVGALTCLDARTGALWFRTRFPGGAAIALTGAIPWSLHAPHLVAVLTRDTLTTFFVNNGTFAWRKSLVTSDEVVSFHFISQPESCAGSAGYLGVFLIAGPSRTTSISFHGVMLWSRTEPTSRFEAQPTAVDSARFLGVQPGRGLSGLFPCSGSEWISFDRFRPTDIVFSHHRAGSGLPAFVAARTGVTPAVTVGILPYSSGILFNVSLPELSIPGASIHAGWADEGAFLTVSRKTVTVFSSTKGTMIKAVPAPHLRESGPLTIAGVTRAAAVVIGTTRNASVPIYGVPLK